MGQADLARGLDAFLETYRGEINALVTILVTIVLAQVVDRVLSRRGRRLGEVVSGGALSATVDTRLRLARRLVFAVIIVIGFALALSSFETIRRLTTGVLASSAVLGIVVGFAARQSIANAVAGIALALAQPIRIGDLVTFEGETGTVEDIRLTYTFVRAGDGRRIIVPNERLSQSTIENHTIIDPRVHVEVSLWVPPGSDVLRLLSVLEEEPDVEEAEVAESERDGIRLVVRTWAKDAAARGPAAARIRAACLERLRGEGLSWDVERSRA